MNAPGLATIAVSSLPSDTISGQTFSVWKYGSNEFIFDLNHNETTGQTNVLTSIDWLMNHGYVPSSATLTEVEFGVEVASTDGTAETFTVSSYSPTTKT
jgi:hypothetical protein